MVNSDSPKKSGLKAINYRLNKPLKTTIKEILLYLKSRNIHYQNQNKDFLINEFFVHR